MVFPLFKNHNFQETFNLNSVIYIHHSFCILSPPSCLFNKKNNFKSLEELASLHIIHIQIESCQQCLSWREREREREREVYCGLMILRMKIIKKLMYSTSTPTNLILLVLPFVGCSSHEQFNEASNSHSIKHNHKVSHFFIFCLSTKPPSILSEKFSLSLQRPCLILVFLGCN